MLSKIYLTIFIFSFLQIAVSSPKTNIAVVDFAGKGVAADDASIISDRFRVELFNAGKHTLVEREMMNEIMKEQGFQNSGCVSDECIVEMGQLLGVGQIIGGSVNKLGQSFSVVARIIDVKTGKVTAAASVDDMNRIEDLLSKGIPELVKRLLNPDDSDASSGKTDPKIKEVKDQNDQEQKLRPFQLSFFTPAQIFPPENPILGLRINILYGRSQNVYGIDIGIINHVNRYCGGIQAGLINVTSKRVYGIQAGLVNITDHLTGAQIGLINIVRSRKSMKFIPILNLGI